MSDEYLRLVANLTPPGRRYQVGSPVAARNRFVLFALAYHADDEGRCTVSLNDLSAFTLYSAPLIRASLRDLQAEHGLVETTSTPSKANTYRLKREALEAQQFSQLLRSPEPQVDLLAEYGSDSRSINALHRAGIDSLHDLGARIAAFRAAARTEGSGAPGFHEFLDLDGIGEKSAQRLLDSYAMWLDDPTAVT